jgi:hypothetical protein
MLKRITKREAQKRFAAGNLHVILCPCKMCPGGRWRTDVTVWGAEYIDREKSFHGADDRTAPSMAWKTMYASWLWFNATYETGYYAHYYVDVDTLAQEESSALAERLGMNPPEDETDRAVIRDRAKEMGLIFA